MRTGTKLAAAAALLCLSAPAQAATIIGQISFTGVVRPIGSTNMQGATGLDFYSFSVPSSPAGDGGAPGIIMFAFGSSGIFNGILCGACGTIKDLPTFTSGPIASFFEIGSSIFFDLKSIKSVTTSGSGNDASLTLIASGTFRIAGLDDTPASLTLTTQGNGATTFSATAVNAVPEPASWALMIAGFGLAGGMLRAARGRVRVRYLVS